STGVSFTPRTTTGATRTKPTFSNARTAPPPVSTRTSPTTTTTTVKPTTPAKSTEEPAKGASTSRTAGIQCHRCHGIGHVMRNCPSQRTYIVTEDGGYISTSDIEEDDEDAEDDSVIFGKNDTENYRAIIVQRVH